VEFGHETARQIDKRIVHAGSACCSPAPGVSSPQGRAQASTARSTDNWSAGTSDADAAVTLSPELSALLLI